MDSTGDADPADELLALTRQLKAQLARHAGLGAWAAPASESPRFAKGSIAEAPTPTITLAPTTAPLLVADPTASGVILDELVDGDGAPLVQLGRRSLADVRAELGDCPRCKLAPTRNKIVFGVGADDAPVMFIGEAPGEQEDLRGEPFVGRAGELLDKMIEAMGWSRATVYIANVLKCRPPGNRNPQPDEVAACSPFLDAQIRAIAPRVIVTLGKPAANHVLGSDAPISALRGRWHERAGVRVMPTFHPAYLLREPDKKRDTWADLKLVMSELDRLGISPPSRN